MTAKSKSISAPAKRNRASVSYPYHSLALCVDLARGVREIGNGKQEVSRSLLASHLKIAESSGDFAQKIASTKTYGLIDGKGTFRLTDLSMGLFFPTSDPEKEKKIALLEAVAQPGAFAALLDRFDGSRPPTHELMGNVLGREMGIPESWKMRVATFFIKSMETAGALGPDGFLRHAAELEKARAGGSDSAGQGLGGQREEQKSKNPALLRQYESEIGLDQVGVTVWQYPFKGRVFRVETPEDMPREVWEKLNRYVSVLEPAK